MFFSAAQLGRRAFLLVGILAVALGAAVLVTSPAISRAQESLQLPPEYYQDLEAYLFSPEAGKDTSVPISPEELGLGREGEGGPSAPAPIPLFSAQSLSTPVQSSTYDFALQFVSINGNVPTVPGCDRNPSGALRSFFDNFDDGLLEEGCTAEFQKFGTFEESGGFLHMRSENGYRAGDGINHNLAYKTTFKDGQGNFFAGAGFRPDVPQLPPLFSSYSLHLFDAPPSPTLPQFLIPSVNTHVLTLSDGRTVVVAGRYDALGRTFRGVRVDLAGKTSVLFGLSVDDATNTVTPYYSFDFGQTVFVWQNPDGSTFTAPLFTKYDEARLMAATFVREPIWDVPLYTQIRSPFPSDEETNSWDDATYANGRGNLGPEDERCGLRIEQCGCAITSAVMVARFYGATTAQGQDVQPFNLDAWLNTHSGYDGLGNLRWQTVSRYTDYRVEWARGSDVANNFTLLDQHLFSGEPLIAKANPGRGGNLSVAPGHFFVIDSKLADGSYRVKDPAWYLTDRLIATTTDRGLHVRNYEGGFDGLRIYQKGGGIPRSSLSASVASPAELLLTDPLGRRVGKDPITGATYDEVPGASYFADSIGDATGEQSPTGHVSKTIYASEPPDGGYTLSVIGTSSGSYTLTVDAVNNEGVFSETQTSGVTDTGISSSFETSFSATAPEPPPLVKDVSFGSIRRDIEIALQLGIVDSPGIAKSLLQKLNATELNAQKGKSQTAQNVLNALKQEVEAQKGKHISEPFVSTLLQDIDALSRSLAALTPPLSLLLADLHTLWSQLLMFLPRP